MIKLIAIIYLLIGYIYGCLSKKRFEKLNHDEWITYNMIIWPIECLFCFIKFIKRK